MAKIQLLNESVAARIAAGEVIERPAGVLKELLENCIDAGASVINIDIENAGKTLIRVNDNGVGMDKDDLQIAVLRHSTSKIKNFEDLETLDTFGFRGEALYSVAAISRLSITSCTDGGQGGKIVIEGGKVISQSPAPNIKGTTIEVRDLFFNTPARLKFLKSDSYERALLLKVVEESALANLHVAYNVRTDGKTVYSLEALCDDFDTAVLKRAQAILGKELAQNLITVKRDDFSFKAFVTPASKLVSFRDLQFFFLNKRPLTSKTLQSAVYKAYQGRPRDRFPAFIIYMNMPASDFDVNIHPQKREVKFLRENAVFAFIMNTLSRALAESAVPENVIPAPGVQSASAAGESILQSFIPPAEAAYKPFIMPKIEESAFTAKPKQDFVVKDFEEPAPYNPAPQEEAVSEPAQTLSLPQEEAAPDWWQGPYRFLGALHRSYLVFENEGGMILLDQHAARERVLYEEYMKEMDSNTLGVQPLMFPVQVDLPASNVENLMLWAPWLKTAGFEIAQFSPRTILVSTVPNIFRFKEDNLRDFIVSLGAVAGDPLKSSDSLKKKTVALLACKKSIKAKESVSTQEAEDMLSALRRCQDGMHCPHGRPVMIALGINELSKKFGR